jgi:hypothetical protein
MDISVKASVTKLNKRAAALNGLVDKKSHPVAGELLNHAAIGVARFRRLPLASRMRSMLVIIMLEIE